jgi:hypothetical protein
LSADAPEPKFTVHPRLRATSFDRDHYHARDKIPESSVEAIVVCVEEDCARIGLEANAIGRVFGLRRFCRPIDRGKIYAIMSIRSNLDKRMTLRQAALVAGFTYLLNPVSYAEFSIYPKLIIPGHIEETVQNVIAHPNLYLVAIGCYLSSFIGDVVIAWALYVLLVPVHKMLSLLTAWFRLIYAAIALTGVINLIAVYHLCTQSEYLTAFGTGPLRAQAMLLLHSFRYTWQMSLVLFGIHLVLLGFLIYRSGYIPKILGILLIINGFGWIIDSLGPYVMPNAKLDFTFLTFFGEVFFMLWLLIRGWKIREPEPIS